VTGILRQIGGYVATLTLDNPAQRNILDEEWWLDFASVLDELEAAPNTRVIVLGANGAVFSAGGDIARMEQSLAAMDAGTFADSERIRMDRNSALLLRWAALPAIRIAVLNGPAVGAGLALALSCDHRIMADTAFVDSGFSRMGLTGDLGATYYLRAILGPHRATAWLLRSRRVAASEALALGLVDELRPPERLETAAVEAAQSFCAISPDAAAWVLRRDVVTAELAVVLDFEREATVEAKQSAFHRDAVTRFVARAATGAGS
jgi:2-(1,2-epoxy-1,2-dihydrophenyl)acetyl-CoA isomerase